MSNIAKDKAGTAFAWVFGGQLARQLSTFVIGVILARLLSPTEFGIIATANIFIAITYSFVDSGFASALIQKKNCTTVDYSTVFFFNFIVSVFFYGLIFILSPAIASFFNNNDLISIVRVLGVLIILYSFSSIQITILKKELNFKIQSKIIIVASVISGLIGIVFAYLGYGVWSLVIQSLLNQLIMVGFYWVKSSWRPQMVFSYDSLKSLFAFGSKLLFSGIITKIYNNLSSIIIAKFYSLAELGFYNRALRFQQLGSIQISNIVAEVSFPLFSQVQDNLNELVKMIRKTVATVMYFSTPLSIFFYVLSKYIILGILGQKWANSIEFLELLSIYGVFYPFSPIITNALMSIGKSNEFLKITFIRRFLDIGVLATGALIGIQEMIWAMIAAIVIATLYSFYIMKKHLNYSYLELVLDLKNTLIISISVFIVLFIGKMLVAEQMNYILFLIVSGFSSLITFVLVSEKIKSEEYFIVKNFIISKFQNR